MPLRRLSYFALCAALSSCSVLEQDAGPPMDIGPVVRTPPRDYVPTPASAELERDRSPGPTIRLGSGATIGAAAALRTRTPVIMEPDGGVTLNFSGASLQEVADAVLGKILGLNYTVDPKVQATITMQTARPIARAEVLPTIEAVLQANGVALVGSPDMYRLVPLAEAARSGSLTANVSRIGTGSGGYGLQVIPLRFTSARQIQRALEPFVPAGAVIQVDDARNVLLVSAPQPDTESILRLVNVFDVDWLRGMSFGLFPLRQGAAGAVAQELGMILNSGGQGALSQVVRIVPIERMNAIMLVSSQPSYINEVKDWIDRLDAGTDESAPRMYVYNVQNSRAADLAKVLSQMFGTGAVNTVQPTTEPGSSPVRLGGGSPIQFSESGFGQGGTAGGPVTGTTSGGGAQGAPPTGAIMGGGAANQNRAPGDRAAAEPPRDTAAAVPAQPAGPFGGAQNAGGAALAGMAPVRVVADERNNALVIMARPREYRLIESAVKKLDILPLQLMIEATVAEVTLTKGLEYGLQWFFKEGKSQFSLSNLATGAVAPLFPGFNYVLSASDARVVLSALSNVTHVNVLSAPQLMVLDHHTAQLQVGDEVPIAVQQARSVINPDSPIVNSIELRNTGVILRVTPRVNANGIATLEIEQEVSDVTRTTTSNIDSPTIQQRRIRSVVAVGDGQTVALGGLIRENRNNTRVGIPFLSDIPVLGDLVSTTTRTKGRTELLILLTPHVVHNQEEARAITDELRSRLKALTPVDQVPTQKSIQ
jgi:general secretion pathway protein D